MATDMMKVLDINLHTGEHRERLPDDNPYAAAPLGWERVVLECSHENKEGQKCWDCGEIV